MDTPKSRLNRRRGSRTPFNPLKSIDNSMEIENIGPNINDSEEHGIKIRTEPFEDHYTVEHALGRGKFATVKRCVCKQTGKTFAAKFQRKRRKAKDARPELLHEIKMLAVCKLNPRFVSIVEVFETRHEMIIVTNYAEGGELYRHIEERENGFAENDVKHLMRQTLEGLAYLHDRCIVHMDIKPQNILLSGTESTSDILLCDLGFSRDVTAGNDIREIIGTPDFVAPEILSYEPLTTRSDMWSAGILTYMLLTGYSPYAGDDKMETFSNISQAQLEFPQDWFEHVSNQAQDFISRLLVRKPSKRMSAHECLEHAWLQESHDQESHDQSHDQTVEYANESSVETTTVDPVITKSAISSINIELVKNKLESICEANNVENCGCHVETNDKFNDNCDENIAKYERDEKESNVSHNNHKLSADLTDSLNQRKALKDLSNQRTASVTTSPLASPIGCRRQLTSSPETILEIEPIKKHHCRRDSQQVSLILKTDLQLFKVESKVWDLDEVVLEENSAVVSKREKEVVITS